jgi:hypothetical protein
VDYDAYIMQGTLDDARIHMGTHTDVCISKGGQGDPEWRIHTPGVPLLTRASVRDDLVVVWRVILPIFQHK